MKSSDSSTDENNQKILLIGDIGKVFLDAGVVAEERCEVCVNMLDAIEAAAKSSFSAIGVVMFGASARLSSALKVLREVSSGAKIILLAQMYEEPVAIQLVGTVRNGTSVADDYLICPVHFSYLVSRISYLERGVPGALRDVSIHAEPARPAGVDRTIEMKIRELEKLATEDDLTGLKNRRYIWEFSRQIIERARKENGRVTLLVFDIDNLKHYNDLYGHLAGDTILKQAGVLMQWCCRKHDVVGRIGGDEFAVVFWDDPQLRTVGKDSERRSTSADHPPEAIFITKRFKREIEKTDLHLSDAQGEGVLTISGGLASFPRDGSTIEELFRQADRALLEAKRSGKNRIYLVGRSQSDISDIE